MAIKTLRNNQLTFQRYGASHPVLLLQPNNTCRPRERIRRARSKPLPGAVLISVMVVLLIVGLLISQTLQTLLLVRRGDDTRAHLRQARELVELGQIVLRQNPTAKGVEEVRCNVDTLADAAATASIHFERLNSAKEGHEDEPKAGHEEGPKQIRISVTYRPGSLAEISATQIVAESENLP